MYGYIAPSTRELKYKVSRNLSYELLTAPQSLFSACKGSAPRVYSDLLSKHSDPRHTIMTPAIRLYIYFLKHPQQFNHNVENMMPHIYQAMKRATLGLTHTVKVKAPKYIRVPSKYILANQDYLANLLHTHITSDPIYSEHLTQTSVKTLTEEEMITQYLRDNRPKQLVDSYGFYEDYNMLKDYIS